MKALILAAGRGRRLWPLTAESPKCLLDIGGTTILEHQLGNLTAAGIGRVVVICGHGVEGVRQELSAYVGRADVSIVYNPFFADADNLISLWAARSEMDADFLLLNGDNVFHPLILPRILSMEASACVAVRRRERYDVDDAKVQLADQRVVRIGKDLAASPTHAESIGILRFAGRGVPAIRRALEVAVMADGARHSLFLDGIQGLIDQDHPVAFCDVGELPWTDVDTPEDLRYVRRHFQSFSPDARAGLRAGSDHAEERA